MSFTVMSWNVKQFPGRERAAHPGRRRDGPRSGSGLVWKNDHRGAAGAPADLRSVLPVVYADECLSAARCALLALPTATGRCLTAQPADDLAFLVAASARAPVRLVPSLLSAGGACCSLGHGLSPLLGGLHQLHDLSSS